MKPEQVFGDEGEKLDDHIIDQIVSMSDEEFENMMVEMVGYFRKVRQVARDEANEEYEWYNELNRLPR